MASKEEIVLPPIAGKVFSFSEIDSTQNEARRLLEKGEVPPFTVIACAQTLGRGRFNHKWLSPRGGIYFSWITNAQRVQGASLVIAMALHRAMRETLECVAYIKWPNDIVLGGKKVAGILTEIVGQTLIIGVGINTFHSDSLAPELTEKATTLPIDEEKKYSLLFSFWENLAKIWADFLSCGFGAMMSEYNSMSIPPGTLMSVSIGNEVVKGRYCGVSRDGELLLDVGETVRKFNAGETTVAEFQLCGEK